ncbi:MAG: hypothetical protein ACW98F_00170 [Candidatus Hodarchaeales archaeon]|jgi:hypothetical protein
MRKRKARKVKIVNLEIATKIDGVRHFNVVTANIPVRNKEAAFTKKGFPRFRTLTEEEQGKVDTLVTRYGKLGRPAIQQIIAHLDPRSLGQVIRYRLG